MGARFDLPWLSPDRAATAVGFQAGLSIGLAVACHGAPRRVRGWLDPHAALARALEGSDCRAVWLDGETVRIERRPAASPRHAQTEPAPAPGVASASEVVVVASKRELTLQALPGSATVLPQAELAATHVRSTSDLRLLASGVTVTNLGAGRDKVLLRGLSDGAFTGHTQSTVGLYWNGAPTTYNAPDPDLRLVDVASVEVLRGPQGTLYGAGALGGVIDISPRLPDPTAWSGSLSVEGATTAAGDPSTAVEAVLNAPLAGGRAALRLVGYDAEEGGWIDLPRLDKNNVNHVREVGVRAAILAKLGPGWMVKLGDIYQDIYSDDTQYTTDGPKSLTRGSDVRQPHDNDFEQAYADLHGHGAWGDVRSLTAFTHHDFASRYDASSALPDFDLFPAAAAYDDNTLVRLASEEIDLRPALPRAYSLLIGGYAGYGDETERTALAPIGQGALYAERRRDILADLALFGEASYSPTDRLTLTAGVRLSHSDRRTLSRVIQAGAQAPFAGATRTTEASPKLAIDYELKRGTHIYALVSRGYRIGGFNTAGLIGSTRFSTADGAQPTRFFAPDSLWNQEIGIKAQGWRGRLQLRSALYYDIWRKLQADQFEAAGLPYVANVGTAHVAGLEGELSVRPYRTLTFRLGALFTAPDLRRVDPSFPAGRSDFTLPGVARRSIDGQLSYLWPLGDARSFELAAAAVYVGHSYLFFGPQGSSEMGRYLDARLQGRFSAGPWGLALLMTNPANNRGDTFAFGNPFDLSSTIQRTPLRPRTVSLRLDRTF